MGNAQAVNKELEEIILEITFTEMASRDHRLSRIREHGIEQLNRRKRFPISKIVYKNTPYVLALDFTEYRTTAYDFHAATDNGSTPQQLYEKAINNLADALRNLVCIPPLVGKGVYQERFGWYITRIN